MNENCTCVHDQENCREFSPDAFMCSRPKGHEGDHVACGNITHALATWPNESTEEKAV